MNAMPIVADWRRCVATQLLPTLHGHQAKAVADFSWAVARAGHCHAGQLALHVPTAATPASARRRWERFVDNPRVHPRQAQQTLARALLAGWTGATVLLLLDETPKANDLRVLAIRLGYQHRAVPLASLCYRPGAPPRPVPALVRSLLRQVRGCLPAQVQVVLLADRGLAWPLVVDWCQEHHWHYVLRLQGQTKLRGPDGSEQAVRDLAPRPGKRWLGAGDVFKKAGWRGANVVATWERGETDPWLLLTDQRASLKHCRTYRKRMWVEESFRDDKSGACHWEASQVLTPARALRLLLVLAVTLVLGASLGTQRVKAGLRHLLDPCRYRRLSVVQLGLRWLRYALNHDATQDLRLGRLYLYPS